MSPRPYRLGKREEVIGESRRRILYASHTVRDRVNPDDFRVEAFDEEGGCEVATFAGPRARERATAFAGAFYESFEERQLTPYGEARSPVSQAA